MQIPKLVDAHAHMQFADYNEDRAQVIQRALDVGIWIINAGSNLENSKEAIRIAEEYEKGVYATVGIHPSEAGEGFNKEKMRLLASHPKCVAIGECGLEYPSRVRLAEIGFSEIDNKEAQAELFTHHINLSHETEKPLVIHCRDAYEDLYEILKKNEGLLIKNCPALMHFFSGSVEDAEKFLELGCIFSFGGAVTFPLKPNQTDFTSLIKILPMQAIVLETDCPYVSPEPFRGKRNEPLYITYVAEKIAEIKGVSLQEIAEQITENAIRFFAINEVVS